MHHALSSSEKAKGSSITIKGRKSNLHPACREREYPSRLPSSKEDLTRGNVVLDDGISERSVTLLEKKKGGRSICAVKGILERAPSAAEVNLVPKRKSTRLRLFRNKIIRRGGGGANRVLLQGELFPRDPLSPPRAFKKAQTVI